MEFSARAASQRVLSLVSVFGPLERQWYHLS